MILIPWSLGEWKLSTRESHGWLLVMNGWQMQSWRVRGCMVWYGILEFNVPLDTV